MQHTWNNKIKLNDQKDIQCAECKSFILWNICCQTYQIAAEYLFNVLGVFPAIWRLLHASLWPFHCMCIMCIDILNVCVTSLEYHRISTPDICINVSPQLTCKLSRKSDLSRGLSCNGGHTMHIHDTRYSSYSTS